MRGYTYPFLLISFLAVLSACRPKDDLYPNPYSGGKQAIGIRFAAAPPVPNHGAPGTEVTYNVTGLGKFKPNELKVYQHKEAAQVISVTDSTLKIKVPEMASTGELSIYVSGQVFFGPSFSVDGKVRIDPTFEAGNGANLPINDVLQMPTTNLLMVGSFTDYDQKAVTYPVNRIVMTTIDGSFLPTLLSGMGANGSISSVVRMPDGKYIVGGSFSRFNNRLVNSITRLNSDGSLDTTQVSVVNTTPEDPLKGVDTVATFNGGVLGSVNKLFSFHNQIIAVGNFNQYVRYFYERSTYDTKILDATPVNQLLRMNEDGSMDSSYNYDPNMEQGVPASNGWISDAVMQNDGKIIIVGNFTKFKGVQAGGIVRIDTSGLPDPTFKSGSGADNHINTITYNAATGKYLVTGIFKHFDGQPYSGMVLLNGDGSIDPDFKLAPMEGGGINFAAQLSSGMILVSGTFETYNGITRNGFMILSPDGSLAKGYNNTGDFQGQIINVLETKTSLGRPAVLMSGYISKFDGQSVDNIVRIEVNP